MKVDKLITRNGYIIPFEETFSPSLISNHLPKNFAIGSKKNLFKSMYSYYKNIKKKNPFEFIPKTYHIQSVEDEQWKEFVSNNQHEPNKIWIIKPGENTNRGNGIKLSSYNAIHKIVKSKKKHENGQVMTYIVQSYINKPLLYNGRKFDIRHYLLLTSVNGIVKAYWYKEGYVRTSG